MKAEMTPVRLDKDGDNVWQEGDPINLVAVFLTAESPADKAMLDTCALGIAAGARVQVGVGTVTLIMGGPGQC